MNQLTTLFLIALSSVAFSRVITSPGEILSFYRNLIEPLPDWLYKPLGGCAKCLSGQVALWSYIFLFDYSIFHHIIFILSTIAVAYIADLIINILEP